MVASNKNSKHQCFVAMFVSTLSHDYKLTRQTKNVAKVASLRNNAKENEAFTDLVTRNQCLSNLIICSVCKASKGTISLAKY